MHSFQTKFENLQQIPGAILSALSCHFNHLFLAMSSKPVFITHIWSSLVAWFQSWMKGIRFQNMLHSCLQSYFEHQCPCGDEHLCPLRLQGLSRISRQFILLKYCSTLVGYRFDCTIGMKPAKESNTWATSKIISFCRRGIKKKILILWFDPLSLWLPLYDRQAVTS